MECPNYQQKNNPVIYRLALFLAAAVLISVACAPAQNTEAPPLPPPPAKANPKLDSRLNQLVAAEQRGEAASFAQQQNIELVAKKVRVIVEALPEQIEAARKAVSTVGTVEASDGNLLQALVPVSGLPVLAELSSIKLIRLPMQAVPGAASSNNQETNKAR